MSINTAHKFQDDFYESLFGNPANLFAHADHDAKVFNKRLTVYRRNVFISLTDVLSKTFSHVRQVLGEDTFEKVAHAFIREHPPVKGRLSAFGKDFSAFLKTGNSFPEWISDLAKLEWSLQETYYGEDTKALSREQLATIVPEEIPFLIFEVSPTLHLFHAEDQKLKTYCQEHFQEGAHTFYQVEGATTEYAILNRQGFQTTLSWVNRPFFDFITFLIKKRPLGQVIEELLTKKSDLDVTLLLGIGFQLGCFTDFQIKKTG